MADGISASRPSARDRCPVLKIAYLTRKFPVLSQTFVLHEIEDHLRAGLDVTVIGTRSEAEADFPSGDLDPIFKGSIVYLDVPKTLSRLIRAIVAGAARRPALILPAARAAWTMREGGRYLALEAAVVAIRMSPILPKFDLIHCHFGNSGTLAAAVLKAVRASTRLVTTFHGYDLTMSRFQPIRNTYAHLLENADLLLTVNGMWREKLIAAGGTPASIAVHHMGVNTDELSLVPLPTQGRAGLLRLAMVGRLTEKKGHGIALEALAHLRARRSDLDVTLDIVGGGLLESTIIEAIASLRLSDCVRLHGPRSHDYSLKAIAEADAFLLPSRTAPDGDMEGIPVSLMEAMAIGRPVISTRHSGIPELVEDGKTGLLADEGDVVGIAAAIERLAEDPQLRQQLARAGRDRVEKSFNVKTQGVKLRDYYRCCVEIEQVNRLT